jgi:DNA-binding NarL/FixJ family response regulator
MTFKASNSPKKNRRSQPARPAKPQKFRVTIADENALCRKGLQDLLEADGRFHIVGATDNMAGTLQAVFDLKPDVAILDATQPDTRSLELISLIRAKSLGTQLVVFVPDRDEKFLNLALGLGIEGYLLKRNCPEEILDGIVAVASGEAYVTPALTNFLLKRRGRFELLNRRQPGMAHLTVTERRVLKGISQGKTSREIALQFGISPRTVDSHRAHICEKLGLSGSNRLLQFALEQRDALSFLE